ncbi:MAG TPA: PP2C family serine/threonine-protein phosphatase [Rubrivivax sp.]|nr:PP2C family serine/threonine-protein phosphatase [Rubrivivax sp.]
MTRQAAPDGSTTPLLRPPPRQSAPTSPLQWLQLQWQLARRPRIESGWATLCGAGHAHNQDAVLAAAPLFAVADGVGGGSAGELASSQLLAWCREIPRAVWRRPEALAARLRQADGALAQALHELSPGGRSATTFAGAWVGNDGRGCIAHFGDSRILRLRPQAGLWQCTALTVDQTYANLGEQPPPGGHPDDPARMVGVGAAGEPVVATLRLRENDWLLLCSDGLHRFVPMPLLAGLCQRAADSSLTRLAQDLAQQALARGSHDDISVLLVRRNPVGGARAGFWLVAGMVALASVVGVLTTRTLGGAPTSSGPAPGPAASAAAPLLPPLETSAPLGTSPALPVPLPPRR